MTAGTGAECNGCGQCCSPVVLPFTKSEAAAEPGLDPEDRRWIANDLVPMGRKEAFARRPDLGHSRLTVAMVGGKPVGMAMFYSCRHFDDEARVCTNYDGRPPTCRGYPWYGAAPNPGMNLPAPCAFLTDVGEVPVPLVPKPTA